MPDDAHLRFRLRESLKVDFHNRNSRARSHYWYRFSSFLILHNFSQLLFPYLICPDFRKIPGTQPTDEVLDQPEKSRMKILVS